MPYSTVCGTVLSNFEANQNYKDVNDPSIYVTFPFKDEPEVKMLAWTTTPWTLPSNLAVAVNPDFDYVKIEDIARKEVFVMAKCRVEDFYKSKDKAIKYKVLAEFKGKKHKQCIFQDKHSWVESTCHCSIISQKERRTVASRCFRARL